MKYPTTANPVWKFCHLSQSIKKNALKTILGGLDVIAALPTGFGKLESNIQDDTFCESHSMCANY
jgi:hypothetical protein